jgi:hypothetical protein
MYRKTLIALARAVISAPAFAQSPCPGGLGRPSHYDAPCTYLRNPSQPVDNPSQPVDLAYHGNPNSLIGPVHRGAGSNGPTLAAHPSVALNLPSAAP